MSNHIPCSRLFLDANNTKISLLQGSGLWQKLNAVKPISCEPRGSGEDFDAVMTRYYEGIQRGAGGLFFAVCRGKARPAAKSQYA